MTRAKLISSAVLVVAVLTLSSCSSNKSAQEEVNEQVSKVYALTADERSLADANAKKYFEQQWPTNNGESKPGKFIACRPTDSNKNGLVSCDGYIVNVKGELSNKRVYAGYRKDLVGVSDEDTVVAR